MSCDIKRHIRAKRRILVLLLRNGKSVIWKLKSSRLSIKRSKSKIDSRSVALSRVFYLKLSGIHRDSFLIIWIVYGQCVMNVKLKWYAICFFLTEFKEFMKFVSYEYRNMSDRREVQLVPNEILTICWKTVPVKTTKKVVDLKIYYVDDILYAVLAIRIEFHNKIGFFATLNQIVSTIPIFMNEGV